VLQLNPRYLRIVSVRDLEGKATVEAVVSLPASLAEEHEERLEAVGRALVGQVEANQGLVTKLVPELPRHPPPCPPFQSSGGTDLGFSSSFSVARSLALSDVDDNATDARGREVLRDFDARHRPKAVDVCTLISHFRLHTGRTQGRRVSGRLAGAAVLLLVCLLHFCGAFLTLPLLHTVPPAARSELAASHLVARPSIRRGGGVGAARGSKRALALRMLEPMTLSAIVFIGAERTYHKLSRHLKRLSGRDSPGGGGGGGDGGTTSEGTGGGSGLADSAFALGRAAALAQKRRLALHRSKLKPVAKLVAEDPLVGTSTLVRMGRRRLEAHINKLPEEDEMLEDQVNEDLAELLLDRLDHTVHLDAPLRQVRALHPAVALASASSRPCLPLA
jgi:hypothetical protein